MSEGAFAIIVKFTLKPGMADAFRPLILEKCGGVGKGRANVSTVSGS